jgi:hypothetical protein
VQPSRRHAQAADELTAGTLAQLLAGSLGSSDDAMWQAAVSLLVHSDADGSYSHRVFELLGSAETLYVAEHLAVDLLGRIIDSRATAEAAGDNDAFPPASETACRWAGMSGRWSMLALVAEQLEPPQGPRRVPSAQRLAIDRMLAETISDTIPSGMPEGQARHVEQRTLAYIRAGLASGEAPKTRRQVRDKLVIRLERELSDEQLRELTDSFRDVIHSGEVVKTGPLPQEADEPHLLEKPRIIFVPNHSSAGRLNQLVLAINEMGASAG